MFLQFGDEKSGRGIYTPKSKSEQPFLKEPLSPGHLAATYDSPGVDSCPLEILLVLTDLLLHLKDMLAEVFSPLS